MKTIHEIRSIQELPKYLNPDSHIFLDIDNTLMTTASEFGSEPWERFMIEHFVKEGIPRKEATDRASGLWKAVQTVSDIHFVEDQTQKIFQQLQGRPIFAITARDPEFIPVTEKQLSHLGLQFSQCKAPFPLEPAQYSKGVFYCGYVPKGKVLQWYASQHPCSHILMVDDYRSHLEGAVELLSIPFTGLRYGFLDNRKLKYTPCEATRLLSKVFTHPTASHFLKYGIQS
jgi:hypothetical protein